MYARRARPSLVRMGARSLEGKLEGKAARPRGYRARMLASIGRHDRREREALLAWRRAMYGASATVATDAYVTWLFDDAPGARDEGPALWLSTRDGVILGQQGAIRARLRLGPRELRAGWALDLMVAPSERGKGIGAVLGDVAHRELSISLGLDVSKEARRSFARQGWLDVGVVPLWVRPLRPSAIARRAGVATPLVRAGLCALDALAASWRAITRTELVLARRVDETFDALWERARGCYPVIAVRDAAVARWRYEGCPIPDRYALYVARRSSRGARVAVAWVALRVGEANGLRTGYIVDFVCAPRDAYAVLGAALAELAERNVERALCLCSSARLRAPLLALGFIPQPSGFPLMMRAELSAAERALASDMGAWFVTFGDADVDRPRDGVVFA